MSNDNTSQVSGLDQSRLYQFYGLLGESSRPRLPVTKEITGAKPVWTANLDLIDNPGWLMIMSSNNKKFATLGMPGGTAAGRLRKMLLFRQLKKHNENVCVRCNKEIETVDDLSVEHIKPWEGISADLFWDLDNVAFSHVRCNRPHRNPGPKIITPEGSAWCSRHKKALPISEFWNKNDSDDGVDYCKECRREKDTRQNHAKKI